MMVRGSVAMEEDSFLNYLFSFICFIHTQGEEKKPIVWNLMDDLGGLPLFCAISYRLYYLKNVKNTHGGVLLLVKLQGF